MQELQPWLDKANHASRPDWEQTPWPGVKFLHLPGGTRIATADAGFVRLSPGAQFPEHRHGGHEWTLVLQGEFTDSVKGNYLPGDLIHQPPGSQHAYSAHGTQELIFAVVIFDQYEIIQPPVDA